VRVPCQRLCRCGRFDSKAAIIRIEDVAARGKNVQQGQIFRRNGSWYVRYYQDEIEDGTPVRKRVCKKLARYSDNYRSKKDLAPLLAEIL